MKIQALILLTSLAGYAQSQYNPEAEPGYHKHDGFYLSMNGGPTFGDIVLKATGTSYNKLTFGGPGFLADLKIGGAIRENLILSGDYIFHVISGPDVDVDGVKGTANSNVSAGGGVLGLGVTYYFMPINIFLNGTLGLARFTLQDKSNNVNSSSESGLGFAVKAGKEWWVGKNWGLGISAGFLYASADDKAEPSAPSYSGKLSTGKFTVMFNSTFN
jgi:hypothetical protein